MSGWMYPEAELASAAEPAPSLALTHRECAHCGATFLAEVVSQHEALCELRPDDAGVVAF